MPLLPYPDVAQLSEAITVMLKPLGTGKIETAEEVHGGYQIAGFILGQMLPDAPKLSAMPGSLVSDLIIKWLSGLDWSVIGPKVLEYIMAMIQAWLSKQAGNGVTPLPPFDPPVDG